MSVPAKIMNQTMPWHAWRGRSVISWTLGVNSGANFRATVIEMPTPTSSAICQIRPVVSPRMRKKATIPRPTMSIHGVDENRAESPPEVASSSPEACMTASATPLSAMFMVLSPLRASAGQARPFPG